MTIHPSLDLAVIGNGNLSGLVDRSGAIVWMCWPRVDADPVFCALIDGVNPEDGFFSIAFDDDKAESEQSYLRNSAMVRTVLRSENGAAFSITDFAPRFDFHERLYNPPSIVRIVEPLSGLCRIRVRMRPRMCCGSLRPRPVIGSNHMRYATDCGSIRLTTDAPVSYVATEGAFVLSRRLTLVLHADEPLGDSIARIGREFQDKTLESWQSWVRHLNLPFEWQETVIRAAITLQLCSFEQTGAIVAALTTSLPEAPHSQRNWDYRYCWIRDAYFTVLALNRVGASVTMERFIDYVTNVISMEGGANLRPVYAVLPENNLEERIAPDFAGYRGLGPVRIGNEAVNQVQHDVYGSVVLAASQMFFDERLPKKGDEALVRHAGAARHAGARAGADGGCRHLGISRQAVDPHLFGRHVLGRLRPVGAHRDAARPAGPGGAMAKIGRRPARGDPFARLERQVERLHRQSRFRPYRRQRAAARRTRPGQGRRSEIHLDCRGHRPGAWGPWLSLPLCRARRFRRALHRLHHLHFLVCRGAGRDRPRGRGAKPV